MSASIPSVWEWEDGSGYSVLDTHDTHSAWVRLVNYVILSGLDGNEDDIPIEAVRAAARRWVSDRELRDEGKFRVHKRWWFGRRQIMLVSL